MFKFFVSLVFVFSSVCYANDALDLETGDSAMQISLQKELYEIIISDSDESVKKYEEEKVFYTNENLNQYKSILNAICLEENILRCPRIFFTTRERSGIMSMYPNGVLAINENFVKRITLDEANFSIAHEFAHYKFQHSRQRVKILAKAVADKALPLREPEQALVIAILIPEVQNAHYSYEDEADLYGINYIKRKNIKINCLQMFNNIVENNIISDEKHHPVEKRCTRFN